MNTLQNLCRWRCVRCPSHFGSSPIMPTLCPPGRCTPAYPRCQARPRVTRRISWTTCPTCRRWLARTPSRWCGEGSTGSPRPTPTSSSRCLTASRRMTVSGRFILWGEDGQGSRPRCSQGRGCSRTRTRAWCPPWQSLSSLLFRREGPDPRYKITITKPEEEEEMLELRYKFTGG